MGQLIDDLMGRTKGTKPEDIYEPNFFRILKSKGYFYITQTTIDAEETKCYAKAKISFNQWLSSQGLVKKETNDGLHFKISKK